MIECVQWQNIFGEGNFNNSFDSLLRQKSPGISAIRIFNCSRLVKSVSTILTPSQMFFSQSVERGITLDLGFSSFQCPLPDQVKDFSSEIIFEIEPE